MNRRNFLKGLLATPVVVAASSLVAKVQAAPIAADMAKPGADKSSVWRVSRDKNGVRNMNMTATEVVARRAEATKRFAEAWKLPHEQQLRDVERAILFGKFK